MANYLLWGVAQDLFAAFQNGGSGRTFGASRLYHTSTEFGLLNADGSKSFFYGSGLVWNPGTNTFTAGTITKILHYTNGAFTDQIDGLAVSAAGVQAAFETGSAAAILLAGADVLDAATRAGGANVAAVLNGWAGNDRITGGAGSDTLDGGTGNDRLYGGAGNDKLTGGAGSDYLDGGSGYDYVSYYRENAVLIDLGAGLNLGAAAGDVFQSVEYVIGSKTGSDSISGNNLSNALFGYGGNDTLSGGAGNDYLAGGDGADVLHGGDGNDRILDLDTGVFNDFITGGAGNDIIRSGAGNDIIDAGTGQDVVAGGAGNDVIYGGPDPDVIVFDGLNTQSNYYYDGNDYSIWVIGPDGADHIYSALRIAFDNGTWVYDVPTETWLKESSKSGDLWLATLA